MRIARTTAFVVLTVLSAASLVVACGGGGGGDAKSPTAPSSSADPASSAPAAAAASGDKADKPASNGGGPGSPTTTTALGDAGDLQGAKLGSSSRTEIETKGESGPKAGPGHSGEPGRRREDVQAVIGTRRDDARACYDKGLKEHPGIEGDLDIKWTIDPQGNVADISVDSTKSQILEPSVGTCIIDVIKKIKFAPSAKGFETRAHYPFNFHPRNAPSRPDAGK